MYEHNVKRTKKYYNTRKKQNTKKRESSELELMRYKNFYIMKLFCKLKSLKEILNVFVAEPPIESSFRGNRKLCF